MKRFHDKDDQFLSRFSDILTPFSSRGAARLISRNTSCGKCIDGVRDIVHFHSLTANM